MSEEGNTGAARKRRRRRRRGGGPRNDPPSLALAKLSPDEEDETGPLEPSKPRGGNLTIELPARFLEILTWAASTRRETVEQCAVNIIRGTLSGMKPAYREAMTGKRGGTVTKAELGRMVAGE